MGNLADMRDGLVTRLETISGLRVHRSEVNQLAQFPCAVIQIVRVPYAQNIGGHTFQVDFRVSVFTNAEPYEQAFLELDDYMASTGSKSIRTALYTSTGSAIDGVLVSHAENVGQRLVNGGSTDVAGADFIVTVLKTV